MNPIDLCIFETVEIAGSIRRGSVQIRRVSAHRFQEFAAHLELTGDLFTQYWAVTHLPSGRRAAGNFANVDTAVGAMIEIARLRNDWAVADEESLSRETAHKVKEIVKRHDPRAVLGDGRDGAPLKNMLNGYAEVASA